MDQCTENFECLVIDNNSKSNQLQDQIFWYKAESHGSFKLGAKELWEASKDLESEDEEEEFDPMAMRAKSKGPKINVRKTRGGGW